MGRGQRKTTATRTRQSGATRDYNALWKTRYARAQRSGLSKHMAKYVADSEVKEIMLADRGLTPIGRGDLELMY